MENTEAIQGEGMVTRTIKVMANSYSIDSKHLRKEIWDDQCMFSKKDTNQLLFIEIHRNILLLTTNGKRIKNFFLPSTIHSHIIINNNNY